MLSVLREISEQDVLDVLETGGVTGIVTASRSGKLSYPEMAPVQPDSTGYSGRIARWFSDGSGAYRLFYVPDSVSAGTLSGLLSVYDGKWTAETPSSFSVWPAVAAGLCAAVLLFFSERRLFFAAASAPFVLSVLTSPVFSLCGAVCFILPLLFAVQRVAGRKGAKEALLRNRTFLFFSVCILFFAVLGGLRAVLLLCCAFAASASCVFTAVLVRDALRRRRQYAFVPVPLYTARSVPFPKKKRYILSSVLWVQALFLVVFFGFRGYFTGAGGIKGLSIPVPSGYTGPAVFSADALGELLPEGRSGAYLPDLGDYLCVQWELQTFPYRPVYAEKKAARPGDSVRITRYTAAEDGKIHTSEENVMTFDETFIRTCLEAASPGSVEYMLARQGRFVGAVFSGSAGDSFLPAPVRFSWSFAALFFIPAVAQVLCILDSRKAEYGLVL